eukprot:Ihof_evm1s203 gene=Ihof_evmTU1s203
MSVLVIPDEQVTVEHVNGKVIIQGFQDSLADVPQYGFDLPKAEVRWYYVKYDTNEKIPFTDVDGIQLETAFRENVEGATLPPVLVLDRLYEVDLTSMAMTGIYWEVPVQKVSRQFWFIDKKYGTKPVEEWVPCDDITAAGLELVRSIYFVRDNITARLRVNFPHIGRQAVFFTQEDLWLFDYGIMGFTFLSKPPSDKTKGWRMKRGFKYTENQLKSIVATHEKRMVTGSPEDIDHLLICVHGIGQKMEGVNVFNDTDNLRASMKAMCLENFSNLQNKYMVLAVDWRKNLKLSFETGDASEERVQLDDVTLEGIRPIRTILNATVLDGIYYMDPICGQLIMDELANQIMRVYSKFIQHHPGFEARGGKVSIFSHSLGSALSFDLICNQSVTPKLPCLAKGLAKTCSLPSEALLPNQSSMNYFDILPSDNIEVISAKKEMMKLKNIIDAKSNECPT